ncbi:MAG: glycoside hydrolase family 3 N-terminal domain-containing protein [Candidatus Dojkabacteria bacterium]|nr:glycoside hydrolase family 3 N-terminal domain-containing protein [Candidatus Dojkabacteria bacterium]
MKYIISLIFSFLIISLFPIPLIDTYKEDVSILNEILPTPTQEELLLEDMSNEEKVGQLFIFGFDGTSLTKENREFLEEHYIGGVLLLSKNISSEKQLKSLIKDIQSTNDIPLFITIDQEGGSVARIKWDDKLLVAQKNIDTPKEAYEDAKYKGEYIKSLGINMNFAPVVEYITDKDSFIYDRVYRGSEKDVYLKSISAIEGYTDSGIISVPKHYPGHSNTSTDSHYDLPVVNITESQWDEYILPFTNILDGTSVDAMMVGHVYFPNIDKYPSTLSGKIIGEKLIRELGYEGLIISDDMEMGALDDIDTDVKIAKRALEAGNDILIYSKYTARHPSLQKDVYEYILEQVNNGDMNIDDKVLKILEMKNKYGILSL